MHSWKASFCEHAGVGINTLNLETTSLDEVSKAVTESAGFVIGSPTLGGHMPTQVTHQCLSCAVRPKTLTSCLAVCLPLCLWQRMPAQVTSYQSPSKTSHFTLALCLSGRSLNQLLKSLLAL